MCDGTPWIGVGACLSTRASLQTGQADFPHTVFQKCLRSRDEDGWFEHTGDVAVSRSCARALTRLRRRTSVRLPCPYSPAFLAGFVRPDPHAYRPSGQSFGSKHTFGPGKSTFLLPPSSLPGFISPLRLTSRLVGLACSPRAQVTGDWPASSLLLTLCLLVPRGPCFLSPALPTPGIQTVLLAGGLWPLPRIRMSFLACRRSTRGPFFTSLILRTMLSPLPRAIWVRFLVASGFSRYPVTCPSRSEQALTSPSARRLVPARGRLMFVVLRPGPSPPVAPHGPSRSRSYVRLQTGKLRSGGDSHPTGCVRSKAHERGRPARD